MNDTKRGSSSNLRGSPDGDDFFSVNCVQVDGDPQKVQVDGDPQNVQRWSDRKELNKVTLASVALLTESEAARVFEMGTTRFKARCV